MKHATTSAKKSSTPVWSKPIPTKFKKQEELFLNQAANDTSLPVSVLIRKAVALMRIQKKTYRGYGFLLDIAA